MQSSPELNPYSAPRVNDAPPALPTSSLYYRQDNLLVIRDGAVLPPRCIHTNRPVGPQDWTKRVKITWTPPWVWVLIVIHLLIAVIVALCINKKAHLTYSLSREARGRLIKRRGIALLIFFVGVAGVIASLISLQGNLSGGLAILSGVIALVALIVLVITNAVSVKKHADGWFSIKGCSPEFLNSIDSAA